MSKQCNFEKVWNAATTPFHNKVSSNGEYTPEFFLAMDIFEEHVKLIKQTIERLENYPCDMSCYLTEDEVNSAKGVKRRFIEILKGELL